MLLLILSGLEVMRSKNNVENDMNSFFSDDKIDVMIVSINPSIRMIPNTAI